MSRRDDVAAQGQRDPSCVERWPECESGAYDPRCCRFPKSCSCTSYPPDESPAASAHVERLTGHKNDCPYLHFDQGPCTCGASAAMLRDEALDVLMRRLDEDPRAALNIRTDHGYFQAVYSEYGEVGGSKSVPGKYLPNLTDALASLAQELSRV